MRKKAFKTKVGDKLTLKEVGFAKHCKFVFSEMRKEVLNKEKGCSDIARNTLRLFHIVAFSLDLIKP